MDIIIYRAFNLELSHLSDDELINHYNNIGAEANKF